MQKINWEINWEKFKIKFKAFFKWKFPLLKSGDWLVEYSFGLVDIFHLSCCAETVAPDRDNQYICTYCGNPIPLNVYVAYQKYSLMFSSVFKEKIRRREKNE